MREEAHNSSSSSSSSKRLLELFTETELEHRAPKGFPVTCPTLDITATWDSGDKNVLLHRPPSQIVSKIHQLGPPGAKGPEPVDIKWKSDGQFLAVGWSDGVVRLMGLENSRAAHLIDICSRSDDDKIAHIGWSCNSIASNSLGSSWARVSDFLPGQLDDGCGSGGGEEGEGPIPSDLAGDLTFLEVETALPKISPLPSSSAGSGEDAMVFTLRTGIDFLFQTLKPEEYEHINVMVVGTNNGLIHLSINDSFVIGTTKLEAPGHRLIHHASSPLVSTHSLLTADKQSPQLDSVNLVPMDLPFISSSPINLSLLTSKLTTLQTLLRYIRQTRLHMEVEWKNTRELPGRFQASLQFELDQMTTGPSGIVTALYHTAVSGHAYPAVKEWLGNGSLAKAGGHKRWDKAVVSGLENLRSLVHENFLPALERYSILLSRLRGLAQFYDTREELGFSVTQITKALDIIGCLHLVGHKMLLLIMHELDHFKAFSTWLRAQIDHFASTTDNDEITEKEATMDNAKVLTYIERYLIDSPLRVFFDEIPVEEYSSDWNHTEDGPGLLDLLEKQLAKYEKDPESLRALPRIEFLVDYATDWSERVFKRIAEAKRLSVRFGESINLSIGKPIDIHDVQMHKQTEQANSTVHVALASKAADSHGQRHVHVFRVTLDIANGISTNQHSTRAVINLGSHTLIDFKFINQTLLILCTNSENTPIIIACNLLHDLDYRPYDPSKPCPPAAAAVNVSSRCPKFYLPDGMTMKPIQMEVLERNQVRGGVSRRIILLGHNRTTLRTFTLPEESF